MMFLSGGRVGFKHGCHTHSLVILLAVLATLLFVHPAAASTRLDLSVNSDTIFRYYERDDKAGKVHHVVPAYEFLRLDYGNFRTPGLSLHAYGWGRVNLKDKYFNNDTAGEL